MSEGSCSTFTNGDIIEILQPGHCHWVVYVGDGHIVHLKGRITGSGDDAVHGQPNVVEKTALESEAKGYKYKVNNIYPDLIPVPNDEVVKTALQMVGESKPYGFSCREFALELKYGCGNLDIIIRNLAPIPGELAIATSKGIQKIGSTVNSSSGIVGLVATKGVNLAGEGVTAMSGALGTAAGKGLAALGSMMSTGAQTLAPIVASKIEPTGYGTMLLSAAECVSSLGESLASRSAEAEETTAISVKQLGSSISSSSSAVGSAVATGLSWLGSASAAGAASLTSYLMSGTEQASTGAGEFPEKGDTDIQK
ncbi:uncharacterized protein [Pyxicephalus adspersus]|uniref:uncharacterized protein n=1 Tax=Pyxicephalus adspersus TaxID=30357 RepID=UPI003B5C04FB